MSTGLVRELCTPPGTIEMARRRIVNHLHGLRMVNFDLEQFAVNCYLQGARDMAETVVNHPGECGIGTVESTQYLTDPGGGE